VKITITGTNERRGDEVSVSIEYDHVDANETWERAVRPALAGWGFAEATLDDLVDAKPDDGPPGRALRAETEMQMRRARE
jgi:hypothetical protein